MKRSTLILAASASGIYLLLILILRSIIPETITPTITLLAIPLVLLAMILATDLSSRTTMPTRVPAPRISRRIRTRDVQYLTRQVQVSAKASPGYFETVLLNHLRDILSEKVSLETGMEREDVSNTLKDARLGPGLLKDLELYRLLYSSTPSKGTARLRMLSETVERIEAWTG